MSKFVDTTAPDGPRELAECPGVHGVIRQGDLVEYDNLAWRKADGSRQTGGMDGVYVVTGIIDYDPAGETGERLITAILDDGEYECAIDTVRPAAGSDTNTR